MNSIRFFLIISIISTVILANFLAALHGYQESMQQAEILFDHKLDKFAEFLARNTAQTDSYDKSAAHPEANDNSFEHDETIIFQVRDVNNNILSQSESFSEPLNFQMKESLNYINFAGARWRSVVHFYHQHERWVLVMEKQDVRYKLAESVILKSVYPIILAIPTIAIIILLIVRRGLQPIDKLASQVTQKNASDLSPLTLDGVPQELSRLTEKINRLLTRLNHSLLREQRFASDAAHELRTPIAALKLQMKNLVDELKPKDENSKDNIYQLNLGVDRMSYLVEQILILNRTLPEYYEKKFDWINLEAILQEIAVELYPSVELREHEIELKRIDFDSKTKTEIFADEFAIKVLFKNLITNAIKYTPKKGYIQVSLEISASSITASVMDSGVGIIKENRQRIFDRFYRLDDENDSDTTVGCGLGLSIVKQIADLHHAKLVLSRSEFETSSGKMIKHGLCVSVVFSSNGRYAVALLDDN